MNSPVVCLHGFLGSPATFDATAKVVTATDNTIRLSFPTLSGHYAGAPAVPLGSYGFLDEAERLVAQLRREHVRPITLVGYSLGGRLALAVAIRAPDLVGKLILVSARRGLDTERERRERREHDEQWARLLEDQGLPNFLRHWEAQPLFASKSHLPAPILERERQQRLTLTAEGLGWSLRSLGLGCQPSFANEVGTLSVPVTLVTGSEDPKFRRLSGALAAELPHATEVVVEGKGHSLLLEAPTEIGRLIVEESRI